MGDISRPEALIMFPGEQWPRPLPRNPHQHKADDSIATQ